MSSPVMADHFGRRVRAVILDLDGTLLTSAGDVRAATREALARLVASGIHVVAATARTPRGVYGVVPEIPWAVCCNDGAGESGVIRYPFCHPC